MTGVERTDDQREAMIALLTEGIERSRFLLPPRVVRRKRIQDKLEDKAPAPEALRKARPAGRSPR